MIEDCINAKVSNEFTLEFESQNLRFNRVNHMISKIKLAV